VDRINAYGAPRGDVAQQRYAGAIDQTSPFSPAGRFGRLSYIAWGLLVSVLAQIVEFAAGGTALLHPKLDAAGDLLPPDLSPMALGVIAAVALVALMIGILFMIRRLHDLDGSGWWALLALIPLVNVFFFLFLLLKAGTPGPNRYGPQRETPGWEKVVGGIGVALLVIALIGILAAILMPTLIGHPPVAS
jgi:uncharacterized membrane protein YhaH (DUF805 family)